MSRRHGQDPLPAPGGADDPRPGQARDPHPAEGSPGLLYTADHHRAARSNSQDGAYYYDYPSAAHRRSYARRTGAGRGFATAKDPASNDISRGWCRLMDLAPLTLFVTTLLVVRSQRILSAWDARQEENQRRAAAGLPPRARRRRKTLTALAAGPP